MQYSLDQLCRGSGNPKIANTIQQCQRTKSNHRLFKNGFTKSKEMRHIAEIPIWCLFHPEFKKYFDNEMDDHERKKNLFAFLRKFGQGFMVVDKL